MDPRTFDTIVKALSQAHTRRSVVAGSLGAALLPFTTLIDEARGKGGRNRKRTHGAGKQRRGAKRGQQGKKQNKHRKQEKGKAGKAGDERCIALNQRCRKHGEQCCDGAKCSTLLGLPLIPGKCRCPQGTRICAGACIPEAACCDDSECGAGATCRSGACVACGALGQPCCAGEVCVEGTCGAESVCAPPCTPDDGECTANGQCCNGKCDFTGHCGHCGGAGQLCCQDATCDEGFACNALGECTATHICDGGVCEPCDVCINGCPFSSVQLAVDAADPGDTVTICAGTYTEGGFGIEIDKELTLRGAGDGFQIGDTTLQGRGRDGGSVVNIFPEATVVLERMRITLGGGSELSAGGITNGGTLTLNDCNVHENTGDDAGGIINSGGTLTLNNCVVGLNEGVTGGIYSFGGGSTVELTNCEVASNRGRGITNGSAMVLTNCSVSHNRAGTGGGIENGGTLTLEASHVTDNHATSQGGGILNVGTVDCSADSTVSGNTAGTAGTENCFDDGGSGCATCPA